MKTPMSRNILAAGIVSLFIVSSISPLVFGYNVEPEDMDGFLENLAFVCSDGFGSSKLDFYKESLLYKDFSSDDVVEVVGSDVVMPPAAPAGGPMDSAWPMKCHDNRHTGQSPYSTIDTTDTVKWRYKTSWQIEGGVAVDGDGTVYFGCFDGHLYALYPNGTLKWKYKTGMWIWSTPAIGEDGTIYVGAWDDYLYAIYPNGTLKWKFCAYDDISSSPAIAEDGTIYFGTMLSGNRIYAVNPDGTEKWHYTTGYIIVSDPAVGDDGTVYIGSGDTYLYAMYPNGTLKWRFKTGDYVKGPPSIAEDGTVYIGSYDDYLYALYPDNGTMKWKCGIWYGTDTNPSIANDGTIYVGSSSKLFAINPDGTNKWTFDMGGSIAQSSSAVSSEGIIYTGTEIGGGTGGDIVAVNPDGTERWRKSIANAWVDSSPSIGEDGTVYIGSSSEDSGGYSYGYLYAFGPGELKADANGPYYGLTDQTVQFTGTSSGGYSPHSYFWDFGDTYTSEEQNPTHTYTNPGNYTAVLTVTDDEGETAVDTTYAWIQDTNTAPGKPTIDGPVNGAAGTTYDYDFAASDPDNSVVYIYVDWGDSTNTGWVGPYDSGEEFTIGHSWSNKDTYTIKAKARDPYGAEGPWETLDVTMPKNKPFVFGLGLSEWLLERFPNAFPILRYIFKL